jgi:hypothetical protein
MNDDTHASDPSFDIESGLQAAAKDVEFSPDWSDLAIRIEHRNKRRMSILGTAAAAVALLTGIGGFALGHSSAPTRTVTMSAKNSPAAANSASESDPATPMTTVAAMAETVVVEANSHSIGFGSDATPEFLGAETQKNGVTTRVWRVDRPDVTNAYGVGTPAVCRFVGDLMVGVSDEKVALGMSAGLVASDQRFVQLGAIPSLGGYMALLAVTGIGTSEVTATFPDGTVSTTAKDGIAVLASAVKASELRALRDFTVSVDGKKVPIDQSEIFDMTGAVRNERPDCSPRLPEPGEQPADADKAKAEITAAVETIYNSAIPSDTKTDLLDDPTGVNEAFEAAKSGQFSEAAKNTTATVTGLVFTSPTEATFEYELHVPADATTLDTENSGTISGRFGTATLIDGVWKIGRTGICTDLSLAGASCGVNAAGSFSFGATVPPSVTAVPGG